MGRKSAEVNEKQAAPRHERTLSEEAHEAYRQALKGFDALNALTIQKTGARLECFAGCSFCCWLRVEVSAHEVFLIADHVRRHLSEVELAALMDRLRVHSKKVLPLTPAEHAIRNIVCPLLKDGGCSVYEVRPQTCRRHHSLSRAACQSTFDHPMDLVSPAHHHPELHQTLTAAMDETRAVYSEAGYDRTIYELGTALEEALTDPDSWPSWQDRMEAFIKASITPAS